MITRSRCRRPRRTKSVAALLIVLALAGCSGGKDVAQQNPDSRFRYVSANAKGTFIPVARRRIAGPLTGSLLSGGTYELADSRGGVVVLNFFASWCGPCQTETPQFDSLYRQVKNSGVSFLGIDVKEANRSMAHAWLSAKRISFPIVYDQPAKTALQLGDFPLAALPATVLIDRYGKVAAVYVQPLTPKDLEPVLEQLTHEA